MKYALLGGAALLAVSFAAPAGAASLASDEIVRLQAEMQAHIDATAIDGALLAFDAGKGEVKTYYPTKAHPKIMFMGDKIVMCADVVDANGSKTMVNFYMAKNGSRFVVFHTTFGEDAALMKMMKDGRLVMAN